MASIEKIPVYKSIYRLVNLLLDNIENMAVKHRKTLGDRIMNSAYESISLIHFAYGSKDQREKSGYLNRFIIQFTLLNTYLRIATERRLIPLNKATSIYELIAEISKQIAGWRKSVENNSVRGV